MHTSCVLLTNCVDCFCKAPSLLPLVIRMDERQLTVQRLMAMQFTVQQGQMDSCRHALIRQLPHQAPLPGECLWVCDAISP